MSNPCTLRAICSDSRPRKLAIYYVSISIPMLLHYYDNVMSRVMDMNEADILAGRAKSASARHYALYELDRLTDAYHHGWQKLGIVISDMLI